MLLFWAGFCHSLPLSYLFLQSTSSLIIYMFLNMHSVLNIPGFWIYQVSEYAGFTQDSEYAWIIPEYAWKRLIMLEYTWVCLNQPEGLFFHVFFVIPCLLEHVVTYFNEVCSLKERKAIFLKTQNLIFFFSSWKCVICFFVLK